MCCGGNTLTDIISFYDRQEALDQHFDTKQLWDFINCGDSELRAWIAKALVFNQASLQTLGLLSILSLDTDATVRVEAVDSLCNFPWPQSYLMIKRALSDDDELVRAYAAYGTALLGNKLFPNDAREVLQSRLLIESSVRVKIDIFEGLYVLGDTSALTHLIECYKADDYRVKCAVLNALGNQLNTESIDQIINFLGNCIVENEPMAVKSTFIKLLAECRQFSKK